MYLRNFEKLIMSIKVLITTVLLIALHLFTPVMASNFSSSVFKYQEKLSDMGDPTAQYKLATMYEMGHGTNVDLDEALKWYKKAAAQNHDAAIRRIDYIDILKNGYKQSIHGAWLEKLKQDANNENGEAVMLLGIMYQNGTGVNQDLHMARQLFKQAVNKNIAGAEGRYEAVKILIKTKKLHDYALKQKQLDEEKAAQEKRIKDQKIQRASALKKEALEKQKRALQLAKEQAKSDREKRSVQQESVKVVTEEKSKFVKNKHELSWAEAVEQQNKKDKENADD